MKNESNKQLTSQQWRVFHKAVKDAGINTEPWWEVVPYSGPSKVLHAGLFRRTGWFSEVLVAAHDDLNKLDWLNRYLRHTGWKLSCEMGHWELGNGDFVIIEKRTGRGGDKKLVIDRLRRVGVEIETITQILDSQTEEIQCYVLSSTEQEVRALAQTIELGANTPINASDTEECKYLRALELHNRGVDHSKAGRQQEAIETFRESIRIDPTFAESYLKLSIVYNENGCVKESIEILREGIKAVNDKNDLSDLYWWLGITYMGYGQWEEAITTFQQCASIDSQFSRDIGLPAKVNFELGVAYSELGWWHKAVDVLREVIVADPDNYEAFYLLAKAYRQLGLYDEEIKVCRQAVKNDPQNYWAYLGLGRAYARQGNDIEEIDSYKEAIRISPDFFGAHEALGLSYTRIGCYREAIEAFEQCLRLNPDHVEAHLNLGIAYVGIGDEQSALKQYKILKTLDNEQANKLFDRIYEQARRSPREIVPRP